MYQRGGGTGWCQWKAGTSQEPWPHATGPPSNTQHDHIVRGRDLKLAGSKSSVHPQRLFRSAAAGDNGSNLHPCASETAQQFPLLKPIRICRAQQCHGRQIQLALSGDRLNKTSYDFAAPIHLTSLTGLSDRSLPGNVSRSHSSHLRQA